MHSELVSIIIPVHNGEDHLADAISTALAQSWANKEIIIVDNLSTDNSLKIAQGFADDSVIVIKSDKKGAAHARNAGLKIAKGRFIQFLDADDLLSPDKISSQVKLIGGTGQVSCCSYSFFLDQEDHLRSEIISPVYGPIKKDTLSFLIDLYSGSSGGMIPLHAWLIPRHVADQAGEWNENLNVDDDGEYFCRVILNSEGIVKCENELAYYRKYTLKESLSAQLSLSAYRSMLKSTSLKHAHLLSKNERTEEINQIFARDYWRIGMASYPQYLSLSKEARKRAKMLNHKESQYRTGPITTALGEIFGWRAARLATYLRYRK